MSCCRRSRRPSAPSPRRSARLSLDDLTRRAERNATARAKVRACGQRGNSPRRCVVSDSPFWRNPGSRRRARRPFTVWTLTARLPLGLKSFDSRAAWRTALASSQMPVPCPGRDRCRAGARECRTRSGNGADTGRIRGAADSQRLRAGPASCCCRRRRAPSRARRFRRVTAYLDAFAALDRHEIAALALTLGVILFAVVTAIALLRTRTRAAREARRQAGRDQRAARGTRPRERAAAVRAAMIVVLGGGRRRAGHHRRRLDHQRTPLPRRVLAFGTWLAPDQAQAMERAVDALRARGQGFALTLTTLQQRSRGRRPRHRRPRGAAHPRRQRHQERARGARGRPPAACCATSTARPLIEALPSPVWARDATGTPDWVNAAYARAVEARDGAEAVARNLELLDRPRATAPDTRARGGEFYAGAAAGHRRGHAPHLRRGRPAVAAAAAPASASTRPRSRRCAPSSPA